jgi:hypothetical protein
MESRDRYVIQIVSPGFNPFRVRFGDRIDPRVSATLFGVALTLGYSCFALSGGAGIA